MEFLKPIASLREGDTRSEVASYVHIWSNMKWRMCSVIIQELHTANYDTTGEGMEKGGQPLSMNSGHTEAAWNWHMHIVCIFSYCQQITTCTNVNTTEGACDLFRSCMNHARPCWRCCVFPYCAFPCKEAGLNDIKSAGCFMNTSIKHLSS